MGTVFLKNVILIFVDASKPSTIQNIGAMMDAVKKCHDGPRFLMCNKIDTVGAQTAKGKPVEYKKEDAIKVAEVNQATLVELSVNETLVVEAFETIFNAVVKRIPVP